MFSMQKVEEFYESNTPKIHTGRAGDSWSPGDVFSPRVWSGKPYASKQITFAPPLFVAQTERFGVVMYGDDVRFWKPYDDMRYKTRDMKRTLSPENTETLAKNDGLSAEDFKAWFAKNKDFEGQLIYF
jgi:hypothetical protein